MSDKQNRRIGSIINEADALPPIKSVDDFLNVELILTDFQDHESNLPNMKNVGGIYYVMTVHYPDDDEEFQIRCGGEVVVRQLQAISKIDDLPLDIKIVKHGNTRLYKIV